jgi:hypothetical protein
VAYLPVFFMFGKYEVPYKVSSLTLLATTVVSLIIYEMIHGATSDIVFLIMFLIVSPFLIAWTINCFAPNASLHSLIPALLLFISIMALVIYEMINGVTSGIMGIIFFLILVPFPVIWAINCIFGHLSYTELVPVVALALTIIFLILYEVYNGVTSGIMTLLIFLILLPFIIWLIHCYHLSLPLFAALLFDLIMVVLLIHYKIYHEATPMLTWSLVITILLFPLLMYKFIKSTTP